MDNRRFLGSIISRLTRSIIQPPLVNDRLTAEDINWQNNNNIKSKKALCLSKEGEKKTRTHQYLDRVTCGTVYN